MSEHDWAPSTASFLGYRTEECVLCGLMRRRGEVGPWKYLLGDVFMCLPEEPHCTPPNSSR